LHLARFIAAAGLGSLDVMDARLERLIRVYQARVAEAVVLLRDASIPLPASNIEWVLYRMPAAGRLGAGALYRKHGYGCCVTFPDGEVDFDFGDCGEIDGFFNAFSLYLFAADRLSTFGFDSQREVESVFEAALQAGEFRRSGSLYYLRKATRRGRSLWTRDPSSRRRRQSR
jgi:hypothetical protein